MIVDTMEKQPRRILLMYITKVSGHRQATVALQKTIKQMIPDAEVMSINGFEYTYPILEKVVNKAYMGVIKRVPQIWDKMYDNPKIVKRSTLIKEFLNKKAHKKLAKLFDEFKPDTIICTQAFPCGMVAHYKTAFNAPFTLIGVLTDFAPHAYWLNPGIDYYIVPSQDAKERFMKAGIPAEAIRVFGIPIRMTFAQKSSKQEIAAKLKLDPLVQTVLIMGGGQGLGPIKKVVKSLLKLKRKLQLVVIAGTNGKLMDWLEKAQKKTDKGMVIYEYANNIPELMDISSLIITKPGGMTTSECLAKGLPMVIVNPIPGQEVHNTNFLIKQGIAIRIDDVEKIADEVEALLNSPVRLAAMSKAALAQGRPNAALDVAKLVVSVPPKSAVLV
jgi:processive 1,2-diacylglycerol beta-glucosyltransferase